MSIATTAAQPASLAVPDDEDGARAGLLHLVGHDLHGLRFVDVGAYALAEGEVFAPALLADSEVIGFEADAAECARLDATGVPGRRCLPHFIGDGADARFHVCRSPYTSSLLAPNRDLLAHYEDLPEVCEVVSERPVQTTRLDDVPGIGAPDFLKIDIQGATLAALTGAERMLATTLVVHAEVEFVPIYRGEPLFSECERHLRARGFMFHHFHSPDGRRVRAGAHAAGSRHSQLMWADAVFIPSFERMAALAPPALNRLAWLLHSIYGAHDFALRCLDAAARGDPAVARRYLALLARGARPAPVAIVANDFSDPEWRAGIRTVPGQRDMFYFICDGAGANPVAAGSVLVFAKSGVARATKVDTQPQGGRLAVFVTADRELDPGGDGFPNRILVR